MGAGRRRAWWNVVSGAELTENYWKHDCGYIQISVLEGEVCTCCGKSEEEYGRLKSEGSERRVSST